MIRAAGIMFITASDKGDVGLFLRRGEGGDFPGSWGFPGGREESEDEGSPLETALRECREEIGTLPAGQPKFLMTNILRHVPNVDYPAEDVEFTTFTQRVSAQFTPTLNDEHSGFAWVPLNEVAPVGIPVPPIVLPAAA